MGGTSPRPSLTPLYPLSLPHLAPANLQSSLTGPVCLPAGQPCFPGISSVPSLQVFVPLEVFVQAQKHREWTNRASPASAARSVSEAWAARVVGKHLWHIKGGRGTRVETGGLFGCGPKLCRGRPKCCYVTGPIGSLRSPPAGWLVAAVVATSNRTTFNSMYYCFSAQTL